MPPFPNMHVAVNHDLRCHQGELVETLLMSLCHELKLVCRGGL